MMGSKARGKFAEFVRDDAGATAIEYALIGSLVSVAIIGALLALNGSMVDTYEYIRSSLVPAMGGS